MIPVVLGLGASLSSADGSTLIGRHHTHASQRLHKLLQHLNKLPNSRLLLASDFFITMPWGARRHGGYLNACALLQTKTLPQRLLRQLQNLEYQAGRRRQRQRWQKRHADIDLLLFGKLRIDAGILQIPHPWMWQRDFVIQPMQQMLTQADLTVPAVWLSQLKHASKRLQAAPLIYPRVLD